MDTRRRRERGSPVERPRAPNAVPAAEAEIVDLGRLGPPSRGPGSRGLVAAGLLALFGLVFVVVLPRGEAQPSPASTNGPSGAAASGGPVVVGTSDPSSTPFPWAWTDLELAGYGRGSSVASIWVLDGLFVAEIETDEGPDGGPFGPVSSVLLASADGSSWSDARVDLPVPGFVIDAGTVDGDRLVVLGRLDTDAATRQVWSTRDGAWTREADPVGADLNGGRVAEIGAIGCAVEAGCGGASWVALVGVAGSHEWEELLVSPDGVRWERPALPLDHPASLSGLTQWQGTWYVVATHSGEDADRMTTDVLSSADLMSWRADRVVEIRGGGRDLAAGGAGLVLVGSVDAGAGPSPRTWLSATGVGWQGTTPEMLRGRVPAAVDLVAPAGDGYVAMNATSGDAWITMDGVRWRNLPAFHAESGDAVLALAAAGDVLLAGGRSAAGRPVLWRAVLSEQLTVP